MTESTRVDRQGITADFERVRRTLDDLLDSATNADFDRPSNGTRWTNEQLLFHMVFGYMIVQRLLILVRVSGRMRPGVSRRFAWMLNAATRPFDAINYRGSCLAARVFDRHRMARKFDRVASSIQRKLDAESERDLHRGMHFPTKWDPLFTDFMTLEEVYRYPAKHFDFHRRQLTIGVTPHGG
jgi:DinB superfamily